LGWVVDRVKRSAQARLSNTTHPLRPPTLETQNLRGAAWDCPAKSGFHLARL